MEDAVDAEVAVAGVGVDGAIRVGDFYAAITGPDAHVARNMIDGHVPVARVSSSDGVSSSEFPRQEFPRRSFLVEFPRQTGVVLSGNYHSRLTTDLRRLISG